MTYSYVHHDSFICGPRLIHMRVTSHLHVCRGVGGSGEVRMRLFVCIYMCAMTHLYVGHDSSHPTNNCAMTDACVCRDSFVCVT